tara:strand:+ start:7436 stop:7819 length:384 start_codon:yes stop_codon:yes gene_type:complete
MSVQHKQVVDAHINEASVEWAYKKAKQMQLKNNRQSESFSARGMRAARARDPKLLLVLEKATEVIHKQYLRQYGEYVQRSDIPENHKVVPTEVQLWREAYKMVDQGTPIENFQWIYGAAALLAFGPV